MRLLAASGLSMIYTKGPGPQIEEALNMAFALATSLGDTDYQLRAVWGLFVATFNEGNFSTALGRAEIFRRVAATSSNPNDLKAGNRLLGFALHMLGRQSEAREYVEGMLRSYVVPTRRSDHVRFQYDQRVAARVPLSAILFLQGYSDQAMENATRAVEEAQSINHALSLGYALSTTACPTALLTGDLTTAERYVSMLTGHCAAHGLGPWRAWGRYFEGLLAARRGQFASGIQGMAAALDELKTTGFGLRYTFLLAEYADLLGKAGRANDGLTVIDEALSRCERGQEGWCLPEILRIKGELLLQAEAANSSELAEELFRSSLEKARAHRMRAWELRTAISLAKLSLTQKGEADALTLLSSIYSEFAEGFDSSDLVQARDLLKLHPNHIGRPI
jgi:predicted ATPase